MLKRSSIFAVIAALVLSASVALAAGEDIIKIKKDVEVPKTMVANDVIAVGANVTVYGEVDNNIVAVGGSVFLKPGSLVKGHIVVMGGDVVRDTGSQVNGKITQVYIPYFIPSFVTLLKGGGWMAMWATISVLALFGFLGIAVLLVALIPEHMGAAVNAIEKSFIMTFLWGVVSIILVAPIAVLLAVSIVGIVLIPFEVMLVSLAMMLGYIAAAIFIGKSVMLAFKKAPPPFIDAILGIIILHFVGFLPFAGSAIKGIFLVTGFGAIITTKFGTVK